MTKEKLFERGVKALKEAGYYHVTIEEPTGYLVACYTPRKEELELLKDPKRMREEGISTVAGRFQEFDLVFHNWDQAECRAWVVRQPEAECSPAQLQIGKHLETHFKAGTPKAICAVGESALDAWFY